MSQPNAYFGLAPAKPLPAGQVAYEVREVFQGRITCVLVTPYLPEALADLLLKSRRPINRPVHHGGVGDQVLTRIIPQRAALHTRLQLDVVDADSFDLYSRAALSAFESDGSQSTGLARAIRLYREPHYGLARQRLAEILLKEANYHPDVTLALACCAACQPNHPFWARWDAAD